MVPSQPLSTKRFALAVSADRLTVTFRSLTPLPGEEEAPPPTPDQVLAELAELGIQAEVDGEALNRALSSPPGEPVEVARGTPPVAGRDGWVELLFPTDVQRETRGDDTGRVDWRTGLAFPEAVPGQELAVLHPPVPGVPGRGVTGEELPPPRVFPARLLVGPGADLLPGPVPDSGVAVAAQAGVPLALRQGRNVLVKVAPLVTLPGDVDLSTGNVKVRGSLTVQGSVRAGCSVVASESVLVRGDVDAAEVAGGRDVTVGGQVLGARIRAGGEQGLRLLLVDLDRLTAACRQLVEKGTRCADALRVLMETRFGQLRRALTGSPERQDEQEWLEEARRLLLQPDPDLELASLEDLDRKLHLIYQAEAAGNIRASYVQNASLQAAGTVTIRGGCFYATIVAGGDVMIAGAFRAGRIVSGGNVWIGEAGSPAEAGCEIEVPKEGRVTFMRVHPGVVVRCGSLTYRFDAPSKGVTLKAGPEGVVFGPA